jgi:hypothetical protein
MAAIFYFPVYLQACKGDSSLASGIHILGLGCAIPFSAILAGISVQALKKYRPQNYVGWAIQLIGFGILSTLDVHSGWGGTIGFQVVLGAGLGVIWISTQFPILAPLPQSNNAHALAFFTWMRCFAQVLPCSPLSNFVVLSEFCCSCRAGLS